jgi:hypothetical protein
LFLGLVLDKGKFLFNGFYGALAKSTLLALLKGRLVGRTKPNVPFAGCNRIPKYFVRWEKNTEGSAMSVGLLVVRLLYRFYVCVHLSKWFTFSVYVVRFLVVVSSFTLAGNVLRVGDVALCCACGKAILLTRCYGLVFQSNFSKGSLDDLAISNSS